MLPLRTIAFLMSFFSASTASLLVPILGVANYMMIYQVYPEHAWWHIPIEGLGIRYSMTAAVCMMMGILINLSRMPSVRPVLSTWDVCALTLVLIVVLSEFVGLPPSRASEVLTDKFVKMMIFVFCMTRIATTKRNFTIVMWTLVVGSFYLGYDAWTAPRGAFTRGRLEVIGGPDFRHSSGLAAHMAAMLPLVAAVFLTTRSWILRSITLMSGALTANTVVLCRTRSAFVGLMCGGVVALLLAPRRRRLRTYLLIAVAAVCAYSITDPLFWDRMMTLQDRDGLKQDNAAMGRVAIWKVARRILAQEPLGVGIGNFPRTVQQYEPSLGRRAAHNTIVLCAAELGLQGFAVFALAILVAIHQTRYCYRRAQRTDDPVWTRYMSYCLLLSIVVSLGAQMFTERLYTEAFWWILALPGCLQRVVLREVKLHSVPLQHGDVVDINAWSENNPLTASDRARGAFA